MAATSSLPPSREIMDRLGHLSRESSWIEPLVGESLEFHYEHENVPKARILLPSLRFAGYTPETAVGDLIDNSLDAGAKRVSISLLQTGEEGSWVIEIADDGCGMDEPTLSEMLRPASDVPHDLRHDLGAYGIGSTLACLSIGKQQHVITRPNGVVFSGATDLDVIVQRGEFVKHLAVAAESEQQAFAQTWSRWGLAVPSTGTVVRIMNIDRIERVKIGPFVQSMKRYIGPTYRYYIEAGREFYVNGEKVDPVDPLLRDNLETKVLLEDAFEYEFPKHHPRYGDSERIGIILVSLPDLGGIDANKRAGFTADKAGFYIHRNRRLIVPASMFGGVLTRHPEYNRFRGELLFPATMDADLGVSFMKSNWDIKPSQSLQDKIMDTVRPWIQLARKMYKEHRRVEDDTIAHDEAVKTISERAPFLRKPKTEREKHAPPGPPIPKMKQSDDEVEEPSPIRTPRERWQRGLADRAEFLRDHAGPYAPFFDAVPEGRRLTITYNVDHPFYERFLIENQDNRSLVEGVDFLVYCLGAAMWDARDDQTYHLVDKMREDISFNLRQLLQP